MQKSHHEYTKEFFDELGQTSANSATKILSLFFDMLSTKPKSVLDVGCGVGCWIQACQLLGVADIFGIDGEYLPLERLLFPADKFLAVDLSKQFTLDRRFDLAICLEVVEHIDESSAETLIDSLVQVSDLILFSAAIPGQGGTHHVNEQWPEYWADMFSSHDFALVDLLRYRIWNDADIAWWYRQNILVAYRNTKIDTTFLAKYHTGIRSPLSIVHPEFYSTVNTQKTWVNQLEAECADLTQYCKSLNAQYADLAQYCKSLNAQYADLAQYCKSLNAQYADLAQYCKSLEAQYADLAQCHQFLENTRASKVKQLEAKYAALEQCYQALELDHQDLSATQQALLASTSWQITQPLRIVVQGLRRYGRFGKQ